MPIRKDTGFFHLTEKVTTAESGSIDLEMRLRNNDGVKTNSIALETEFKLPDALQYPIVIDGRQIGFGEKWDKAKKAQFFFPEKTHEITISLPDGLLTIQGKFACNLQDNRAYAVFHHVEQYNFCRRFPKDRRCRTECF